MPMLMNVQEKQRKKEGSKKERKEERNKEGKKEKGRRFLFWVYLQFTCKGCYFTLSVVAMGFNDEILALSVILNMRYD